MLRVLLRFLFSLAPNPFEAYYQGILRHVEAGGPTLAEAQRDYQDYLHVGVQV